MVGPFVLGIIATPFIFAGWVINRVLEHRMRVHQLQRGLPPASRPQLAAVAGTAAVPPELERRIANLEAVICDLDFDLARRVRETSTSRAS
ncbi:MAG: hypothetical protein IPH07_13600 [Deltaproteobacteria bacterium]|nr:hypothetical protein [Deltaproteobacteria bacterium]MBK8241192.1 hypothetical protein [Deltaproteobacteria bacterium]MBK8716886.1 hypothetical protein [Deltaproteobacteria bacterium]MBP7286990.1 hypothetical protein [Nannocystaceae bacterium]